MLHHTRAVRRGTRRALLVADMPYGSYHDGSAEAVRNAVRFVKEGGAEAVKIEGGERRMELIARMVEAEIPVMGHIGLTPQSVNAFGGFRVQGKTVEAGEQLLRDARAVEAAGAFSIVLESIPRELAASITARVTDSDDRHRRRARLRWPDSGDSRFAGLELRAQAEIRAPLCRGGGNDFPRGRGILPRRAAGELFLPMRSRTISRAEQAAALIAQRK